MHNEFLHNKKLLFLSPIFYDYHAEIKKTLEESGATVDFHTDSLYSFLWRRVKNINNPLFKKHERRYLDRILKLTKDTHYDFIFVVKGDALDTDFLLQMRRNSSGKMLMYQWDSIRNYDYLPKTKYFDKIFSFDTEDCKKYPDITYLPLFYTKGYEDIRKNTHGNAQDIDLLFIGELYEDRPLIIEPVRKFCKDNNINFIFYTYIDFSYYMKKAAEGERYKNVRFSVLSREKVYALVNRTKVILDIQSINQKGLSMRTVEALGAGKRIVTTNENIQNESFYNSENIAILKRDRIQLDRDFLKKDKSAMWNPELEGFRIDNWVRKIFS